jgi:hypothetical protein
MNGTWERMRGPPVDNDLETHYEWLLHCNIADANFDPICKEIVQAEIDWWMKHHVQHPCRVTNDPLGYLTDKGIEL